jgi:hypothetical protein
MESNGFEIGPPLTTGPLVIRRYAFKTQEYENVFPAQELASPEIDIDNALGSTTGMAVAQMIRNAAQAQQSDRPDIDIAVHVEGVTEETSFPPLFLTKKQIDALEDNGYLHSDQVAEHLCRIDTPDGLSDSARWVLDTHFVAGEPTAELTRMVSFSGVRGKVAPAPKTAPTGIPFDHTREVLKAMNQVRQALDIQEDITEEELREGQKIMLKDVSPTGLVNASVFDRAFGAAQSPKKAASFPSQAELIRRYVDAKVAKAVEENTPHIPKNVVDAKALSEVNWIANRIGGKLYFDWPLVSEQANAEVQQQAWNEWAEKRAMNLASERVQRQEREQQGERELYQLAKERQRKFNNTQQEQDRRIKQMEVAEFFPRREDTNVLREPLSSIKVPVTQKSSDAIADGNLKKFLQSVGQSVQEETPAITPDEWLKMPF